MAAFTVEHIDHVEVMVRDINAAATWYEDVLGLKETHRWEPEPVFLEANNTALALFKADGARANPGTDVHWHRVAWRTNQQGFEDAQRYLREKGIKFRGPVDHEIAWSIYFENPDGNPLEITYYVHAS